MAQKKIMTIDCTPSWVSLVPLMVEKYNSDENVKKEMFKMARAADKCKEYQDKLIAIEQRINGEWGGKELQTFMIVDEATNISSDVLKIINA